MTIKPMTLEEAVKQFCLSTGCNSPHEIEQLKIILKSYATFILETARPNPGFRAIPNKSVAEVIANETGRKKGIADYHSAAVALINKE